MLQGGTITERNQPAFCSPWLLALSSKKKKNTTKKVQYIFHVDNTFNSIHCSSQNTPSQVCMGALNRTELVVFCEKLDLNWSSTCFSISLIADCSSSFVVLYLELQVRRSSLLAFSCAFRAALPLAHAFISPCVMLLVLSLLYSL